MEYNHETESVTFFDGKETRVIHKDAFEFVWQEGLSVQDGDAYLVKPVKRRVLVAHYGKENHFITVPVDGDKHAQALHYAKRDAKERAHMRKALKDAGAWRLDDDGNVPDGEG